MNKIKLLLICSAPLILAGCATSQNYALATQSWVGASTRSLFKVWGYPNRKMKLQNGHTLYIYVDKDKGEIPATMFPGYTTVSTRNGHTVVSATPPVFTGGTSYNLKCMTWFEINKKSRIVGTSFRGNNCVGSSDFLKNYSRPNN